MQTLTWILSVVFFGYVLVGFIWAGLTNITIQYNWPALLLRKFK